MHVSSNSGQPSYFSLSKDEKITRSTEKGRLYDIAKTIRKFDEYSADDLIALQRAFKNKYTKTQGLYVVRKFKRAVFDILTKKFQSRLNDAIVHKIRSESQEAKTKAEKGNFVPLLNLVETLQGMGDKEKKLFSAYLSERYAPGESRKQIIQQIMSGNASSIVSSLIKRQELAERFAQFILKSSCFINFASYPSSDEKYKKAVALATQTVSYEALDAFIQSTDFSFLEKEPHHQKADLLVGFLRAKHAFLSKKIVDQTWYAKVIHEKPFTMVHENTRFDFHVNERGIQPKGSGDTAKTARLCLACGLSSFNDWKRIGRVFTVSSIIDCELKDDDIGFLRRLAGIDLTLKPGAASTVLRAAYILVSQGAYHVENENLKNQIAVALEIYNQERAKNGFHLDIYEIEALSTYLQKEVQKASYIPLSKEKSKNSNQKKLLQENEQISSVHPKVMPYKEEFSRRAVSLEKAEGKAQVQEAYDIFLQTANRIYEKAEEQSFQLSIPEIYRPLHMLIDRNECRKNIDTVFSDLEKFDPKLKKSQLESYLELSVESDDNISSLLKKEFQSRLETIKEHFQDEYDLRFVELFALLPENPPTISQLCIYHAQGRLGEITGLQDSELSVRVQKKLSELLSARQEIQKCERILKSLDGKKSTFEIPTGDITAQRCYKNPLEKPYLQVFEVFLNIFAKESQIEVISQLENGDSKAIVQLLMGSGKTFLLLPLLGFIRADGENIASVMLPDALLLDQINALKDTLGSAFGSFVCLLPEIKTDPSQEELERIYNQLLVIRSSRGILVSSPERKHALLNVLPTLLQRGTQEGNVEKLSSLLRILHLLEQSESVLGDEVDTLLKTTLQYIITQGEAVPFDMSQGSAIADLAIYAIFQVFPTGFIAQEEEYRAQDSTTLSPMARTVQYALEQLLDNSFSREDFSYVRTILTERRKTPHNHIECEKAEKYFQSLSKEQREYLLALRTTIQVVLPQVLTSYCNAEYGVQQDQETPIACPFQGPNCPTKTQFSSPIEQIVRSVFALKLQGIPLPVLEHNASKKVDSDKVVGNQEEFRKFIHSSLVPKVMVHPERVSSTAHKLFSSVHSFSGISGTFWNVSTFPFFDHTYADVEQEVDALLKLGEKAQEKGTLHFVKKEQGRSSENEILQHIAQKKPPAVCLIDTGGWLRETSLGNFIQQIFEQREDIERVVFHNNEGRLVQLSREIFNGLRNEEVENISGIKNLPEFQSDDSEDNLENRFTIYQQQYVTGTNIPQAATGRGILTAWNKMILRDMQQSIFRLRQILQDQSCTILYDNEFDVSMAATISGHAVGHPLSFPRFLRYLITTQENKRIEENYSAVHQRMRDALEAKVRQHIIHEGVNAAPEEFPKIFYTFQKAKWLFVEQEKGIEEEAVWHFPEEVGKEVLLRHDIDSYVKKFYPVLEDIHMEEKEAQALLEACYKLEDLNDKLELVSSESEKMASQIGQQVYVQRHIESLGALSLEGVLPHENVDSVNAAAENEIFQKLEHEQSRLVERREILSQEARMVGLQVEEIPVESISIESIEKLRSSSAILEATIQDRVRAISEAQKNIRNIRSTIEVLDQTDLKDLFSYSEEVANAQKHLVELEEKLQNPLALQDFPWLQEQIMMASVKLSEVSIRQNVLNNHRRYLSFQESLESMQSSCLALRADESQLSNLALRNGVQEKEWHVLLDQMDLLEKRVLKISSLPISLQELGEKEIAVRELEQALEGIKKKKDTISQRVFESVQEEYKKTASKLLALCEKCQVTPPAIIVSQIVEEDLSFLTHLEKAYDHVSSYERFLEQFQAVRKYENRTEIQKQYLDCMERFFPTSYQEIVERQDELKKTLDEIELLTDARNTTHDMSELEELMSSNPRYAKALYYKEEISKAYQLFHVFTNSSLGSSIKAIQEGREYIFRLIEEGKNDFTTWAKETLRNDAHSIENHVQSQLNTIEKLLQLCRQEHEKSALLEAKVTFPFEYLEEMQRQLTDILNHAHKSSQFSEINTCEKRLLECRSILQKIQSEIEVSSLIVKEIEEKRIQVIQERLQEISHDWQKMGLPRAELETLQRREISIQTFQEIDEDISALQKKITVRQEAIEEEKKRLTFLLENEYTDTSLTERKELFSHHEVVLDAKIQLQKLLEKLENPNELQNFESLQAACHNARELYSVTRLSMAIDQNNTRYEQYVVQHKTLTEHVETNIQKAYSLKRSSEKVLYTLLDERLEGDGTILLAGLKESILPTTLEELSTCERAFSNIQSQVESFHKRIESEEKNIQEYITERNNTLLHDIQKKCLEAGVKPFKAPVIDSSLENFIHTNQLLHLVVDDIRQYSQSIEKLQNYVKTGSEAQKQMAQVALNLAPKTVEAIRHQHTVFENELDFISSSNDLRELETEIEALTSSWKMYSQFEADIHLKTITKIQHDLQTIASISIQEAFSHIANYRQELASAIEAAQKDFLEWKQKSLNREQLKVQQYIENETPQILKYREKCTQLSERAQSLGISVVSEKHFDQYLSRLSQIEHELKNIFDFQDIQGLEQEAEKVIQEFRKSVDIVHELETACRQKEENNRAIVLERKSSAEAQAKKVGLQSSEAYTNLLSHPTGSYESCMKMTDLIQNLEFEIASRTKEIEKMAQEIRSLSDDISSLSNLESTFSYGEVVQDARKALHSFHKELEEGSSFDQFSHVVSQYNTLKNLYSPEKLQEVILEKNAWVARLLEERKFLENQVTHDLRVLQDRKKLAMMADIDVSSWENALSEIHALSQALTQLSLGHSLQDARDFEAVVHEKIAKPLQNIQELMRQAFALLKNHVSEKEVQLCDEIVHRTKKNSLYEKSVASLRLQAPIQGSEEKWIAHIHNLQNKLSILQEIENLVTKLEMMELESSLDSISLQEGVVSLHQHIIRKITENIPRDSEDVLEVQKYLEKALQEIQKNSGIQSDLTEAKALVQHARSLSQFSNPLVDELDQEMKGLYNQPIPHATPKAIIESVIAQRNVVLEKATRLQQAIESWRQEKTALEIHHLEGETKTFQSYMKSELEKLRTLESKLSHIALVEDQGIKKSASEYIQNVMKDIEQFQHEIASLENDFLKQTQNNQVSPLSLERAQDLQRKTQEKFEEIASRCNEYAQKVNQLENQFKQQASSTWIKFQEDASKVGLELSLPANYVSQAYSTEDFSQVYSYIKTLHENIQGRYKAIHIAQEKVKTHALSLQILHTQNAQEKGVKKTLKDILITSGLKELEALHRDFRNPNLLQDFDKLQIRLTNILERFSITQIDAVINPLVQKIESSVRVAHEKEKEASLEVQSEAILRSVFHNDTCFQLAQECDKNRIALLQLLDQVPKFSVDSSSQKIENQLQDHVVRLVEQITTASSNLESHAHKLQQTTLSIRNNYRKQRIEIEKNIRAISKRNGLSLPSNLSDILSSFPKNIKGHEKKWHAAFQMLSLCLEKTQHEAHEKVLHEKKVQEAIRKIDTIDSSFQSWKKSAIQEDVSGSVREFFEGQNSYIEEYKVRCLTEEDLDQVGNEFLQFVKQLSVQALQTKNDHLNVVTQLQAVALQMQSLQEQIHPWSGTVQLLSKVFYLSEISEEYEKVSGLIAECTSDVTKYIDSAKTTSLFDLQSALQGFEKKLQQLQGRTELLIPRIQENVSKQQKAISNDLESYKKEATKWGLDTSEEEEVIQRFQTVEAENAGSLYGELDKACLSMRVTEDLCKEWDEKYKALHLTLSQKLQEKRTSIGTLISQHNLKKDFFGGVFLALCHHGISMFGKKEYERLKELAVSSIDPKEFEEHINHELLQQEKSAQEIAVRANERLNLLLSLESDHTSFCVQYDQNTRSEVSDLRSQILQARTSLETGLYRVIREYSSLEESQYENLIKVLSAAEEETSKLQKLHVKQKMYVSALHRLSELSQQLWPSKLLPLVNFKSPIVRQKAMKLFEEQQVTSDTQLMAIWLADLLKGIGNINNYSITDLRDIRQFMGRFFASKGYQDLLQVDLYAPGNSLAQLSASSKEDSVSMKIQEAFDIMCAESIFNRLQGTEVLDWEEPGKIKAIVESIQNQCRLRGRPLCFAKKELEFIAAKLIDVKAESMDLDE